MRQTVGSENSGTRTAAANHSLENRQVSDREKRRICDITLEFYAKGSSPVLIQIRSAPSKRGKAHVRLIRCGTG